MGRTRSGEKEAGGGLTEEEKERTDQEKDVAALQVELEESLNRERTLAKKQEKYEQTSQRLRKEMALYEETIAELSYELEQTRLI